MDLWEESCAESELETTWLEGKTNALKVTFTNIEGNRDKLKGLV